MGYDLGRIEVVTRVSRHNDERDARDDEAKERLRQEITDLIEADPDYRRIAEVY